jgi:hypothetical protein
MNSNKENFDTKNLFGYQVLVDAVSNADRFKELAMGNPKELIWDYDFLMTIIDTITTTQKYKLKKIKNFSIFWMVSDYIYEATLYAIVNNRKKVGQEELLNTFKHWEYIPLDIKLYSLDEIMQQEKIDYSKHPFKISEPRKKTYQKIISFPYIESKSE